MKRKKNIFLSIFIILIIFLIIFITLNSGNRFNILFGSPSPIPTVGIQDPEEIENVTPAASKNIEVLNPRENDKVESGFVIKGNARTFENTVNIRLLDSENEILIETFTTANAPEIGEFGSFETEIEYESEEPGGVLEVFQIDQESGEDTDKVIIPLIFT